MTSKKKDLEIICNLQWKNKSNNGGDRSNIIGVYDIPSTTLNWEIFKSYLLKNSGTAGDDVRVSYLATNDKEFPIQCQLEFQVALYAFRKKARNGEIINLKLDRISEHDKTVKKASSSNDVQTQFNTDEMVSSTVSNLNMDVPPPWFTAYMMQFKKEVISEITSTVSSNISNMKPHAMQSYHTRKSKAECTKRSRKYPISFAEGPNEKELLKSVKLDRKLESKLEKLECKTKKIKEKKLSLFTRSSDSDAGHSSSKSNSNISVGIKINDMNAAPVRTQQAVVPHLMGGEVYLHQWDVINNGSWPWTSDTELHFTWGSAPLEPVDKIVPCPPLRPGEKGSIAVLLNIPKSIGRYECYWYFHHKGQRFGHWLGCQVVVDQINSVEPLCHSFVSGFQRLKEKHQSNPSNSSIKSAKPEIEQIFKSDCEKSGIADQKITTTQSAKTYPQQSRDNELRSVKEMMEDLKIADSGDTNCSSDSDNQSEGRYSNANKGDNYVFVSKPFSTAIVNAKEADATSLQNIYEEIIVEASPSKIQIVEQYLNNMDAVKISNADYGQVPAEPVETLDEQAHESDDNNNNAEVAHDSSGESISKIEEETASNSTCHDIVIINFDELDAADSGYAYVLVDGSKVPVPKKFLRQDYLETAEDAPYPLSNNESNCDSEITTLTVDGKVCQSPASLINLESIIPEYKSTEVKQEPMESLDTTSVDQKIISEKDTRRARYMEDVYGKASENSEFVAGIAESIHAAQNSRLFIFPQFCPGFEVINAPSAPETSENSIQNYNWSQSGTNYAFARSGEEDSTLNDQFSKCSPHPPPSTTATLDYCGTDSLFTSAISQTDCMRPSTVATRPDVNRFKKSTFSSHDDFISPCSDFKLTLRDRLQAYQEEKINESNVQFEPRAQHMNSSNNYCPNACSSPNTAPSAPPAKEAKPKGGSRAPGSRGPLSENVVSGAVNVASAALNSVINMFAPPDSEPGKWVNGHWISVQPESPREANLRALAEMGFWDRDLNASLLARYKDDIAQVVTELIP